MKKYFLVAASLAAFALITQQVFVGAQQGVQAARGPVAVVNVGKVFQHYKKAQVFKEEMEATLKPYKDAAKAFVAEIEKQQIAHKTASDVKTREAIEAAMTDNRRKLEDMDRQVKKLIGKRQEDQLQQLWKEVNGTVEAYAKANGIQVVMGYGDPLDTTELNGLANITRKMNALDMGAGVPLFVANGMDITDGVVTTLNHYYAQARQGAGGIQQTGGTAPAAAGQK